ncbi:MAG: hypothetical protein CMM87_06005 [Rickettsiales bacterium]|nr:hypothetical protein [Rickettsiales bacterium]|tara:strand:+ start:4382 stop:5665 length:1284 start_codon:yes stop_codon:yes gene_type:complete
MEFFLIFIFPFIRKGGETLLFSWLISLEKGGSYPLAKTHIKELSEALNCHSASLKRKLNALSSCEFFTIEKKRGQTVIHRSDKDVRYQGVIVDTKSLSSFRLSNCELVLFSALVYFHLKQKDIPPRCKLAAMTGFSMRQIAYSLKSLKSKKLLIESNQTESYVRNTQEEGRVEDIRVRKVHCVNPAQQDILNNCKIAPLKDINKNPVNTNGFIKSDLKDIANYFSKSFNQSSITCSELNKSITKHQITNLEDVRKAIDKVKATPFLHKAMQFGWQEAVIECYQQQKARIWEKSKHLTKYCQKKLGINWILKNLKRILSGYYDQRSLSDKAQKIWNPNKEQQKDKTKPEKQPKNNQICERKIKEKIQTDSSYAEEERGIRLHLMEKLGASIYHAWIDTAQVILEKGTLVLKGRNRFVQDRLDLLMLKI